MVASSSNSYLTSNHEVVNINKNKEFRLRKINQNGQIQIYQSSYQEVIHPLSEIHLEMQL